MVETTRYTHKYPTRYDQRRQHQTKEYRRQRVGPNNTIHSQGPYKVRPTKTRPKKRGTNKIGDEHNRKNKIHKPNKNTLIDHKEKPNKNSQWNGPNIQMTIKHQTRKDQTKILLSSVDPLYTSGTTERLWYLHYSRVRQGMYVEGCGGIMILLFPKQVQSDEDKTKQKRNEQGKTITRTTQDNTREDEHSSKRYLLQWQLHRADESQLNSMTSHILHMV